MFVDTDQCTLINLHKQLNLKIKKQNNIVLIDEYFQRINNEKTIILNPVNCFFICLK